MNESITVIDKNGNSIVAEGIACIQFISSGKKYILYTLNEKVENDLTKMYVGEIGVNVGELDRISDEDWLLIKNTLNGISHGEANPDLKYINMKSLQLNIGVPKKLAIKADVKQALNDRYNMEVLKEIQASGPINEPVAQPTTGFFNSDVVDSSKEEPAIDVVGASDVASTSDSIFANPLTPDLSAPTVDPSQTAIQTAPALEAAPNSVSQVVMQTAPTTPMPSETPSAAVPDMNAGLTLDMTTTNNEGLVETMIPTSPVESNMNTSNNPGNPVVDDFSNQVMNNINNVSTSAPVMETTASEPQSIASEPMMSINESTNTKTVTKEEALAALDVINRYIMQNGGTVNALVMSNNEGVTPSTEPLVEPENNLVLDSVNPSSPAPEKIVEAQVAVPPIMETLPLENTAVSSLSETPVAQAPTPVMDPVVSNDSPMMQQAPTNMIMEGTVQSIPEIGSNPSPQALDLQNVPIVPEPVAVSTPPVSSPNEVTSEPSPVTPANNFISMGVDDINNMVASSNIQPTGDALAITGETNLINLDAIPSVPEISLNEQNNPMPAALNNQPISNAYVNSDPSGIPVTLPNNYNAQASIDPSSVLGPGSLPVDNNN